MRFSIGSTQNAILRVVGPHRVRRAVWQWPVLAALLLMTAGCGPGGGGVLVVNSAGDAGDDHPGDGVCRTSWLGNCTLRAAIEEANALAGSDIIHFNLPAVSLIIRPHTALPVITGELTIDATTQPGYSTDPIVTVDGSDLETPLTNGLETASGSDVSLRGLQVVHATKHGIQAQGNMHIQHVFSGYNLRSGLYVFGDPDQVTINIEYSEFSENTGSGVSAVNADITPTHLQARNNHFGGMALANGRLFMSASQIEDNVTPAAGGGLSLGGPMQASLYTTEIINNQATDVGGGVFFQGGDDDELSFWHCTLSGNDSSQGGGLYQQGGYVNLDPGNTLDDNRASTGGGGIYLNGGSLDVGRSTIGEAGHGNNADAEGNTIYPLGGGIYNQGGNLFIFSSSVDSNFGSGIHNAGGSVRLYNTHVVRNDRQGIHSLADTGSADVHVESSWISFNGTSGIEAEQTDLTVTGSSIAENNFNGIITSGGYVTISDSTIADNNQSGLYLENSDGADIERSTFWGNGRLGPFRGGGILVWNFTPALVRIENTTIHGNRASISGGGLDVESGTVLLNNVTMTQNVAPNGAGIYTAGALSVGNSILAENTCSGPVTSLGYNIADGSSCGLSAASDQPDTAIPLGPMQDNGGPTFTRAITASGPAIDAGNDATCAPTDQRGVARPQGARCDIGAFELETGAGTPPSAPPSPTLTPPHAPLLFDPVSFSSDTVYQGGKTCSPTTLTVVVQVAPPESVQSVALYYRLVEKEGANSFPWNEGVKMVRLGNGRFQLELSTDDLPSIYGWNHEAWLDIQFIAYGAGNQLAGRSEVIRQVTVQQCRR